jgi:hypothetical protein
MSDRFAKCLKQARSATVRTTKIDTKEGTTMKKITFATAIASVLTAGVLGLAAPAMADIGHHDWVNNITNPTAQVPHVDTTVHQSH